MDLSLDDTSLTPWVHFSHKGRDDECTVVHYLDGVPFVSRLSDPDATVAAVLHTTNKFLGLPGTDLRVIDCSSGLNLAMGHPAAGMCLWIAPNPVHAVPAHIPPEVSPTIPWIADDPIEDVAVEPSAGPASAMSPRLPEPAPEPLASLDAARLSLIPEPSIPDVTLVHALRKQTIDSETRKLSCPIKELCVQMMSCFGTLINCSRLHGNPLGLCLTLCLLQKLSSVPAMACCRNGCHPLPSVLRPSLALSLLTITGFLSFGLGLLTA